MDEWLQKYADTINAAEDSVYYLGLIDEIPTKVGEYQLIVADYGLRRFDNIDAVETAQQLHRAIAEGGHLIVRLKSMRDPRYSAARKNQSQTEPGCVTDARGRLDRFFDESEIEDYFSPFFRIDNLCEELLEESGTNFVYVGCFERI